MNVSPAPLPYVSQFIGVRYYMHALTMAAAYSVRGAWKPPANSPFLSHVIPWCWEHPLYPRHIVHTPRDGAVVVTQLSKKSDLRKLRDLGDEVLGPRSVPTDVVRYPLCVRVRLLTDGPPTFPIPDAGMQMARLWPLPGRTPLMTTIRQRPVEMRIDGGRRRDRYSAARPTSIAAAAYIGRAFETRDGRPRSKFFAADARHVLIEPNQHELEMFTAHVLDALLNFVHDEGPKLGVFLDPTRRLPGTQIGKVYKQQFEDDVEYRIRLPLPNGSRHRYVSTPGISSWYA